MLKSDSVGKVENHLERWEGFYMQNYAAKKEKTVCFLRTTWAWNVAPRQRTYLACSRPWDPDPVSGSNSNHNHKQLLLGKKQLPCPKDLHVDSLEKLQMDRREAENQGVLWGVGVGPG